MTWSEQHGRDVVYQRSLRLCEVCGRAAASVHHRMKQGRPWAPGNLLSLCGDGVAYCHGWIEAHPGHALALGLWLPRGADWATWPVYARPAQFYRDWWYLADDGTVTLDVDRSLAAETAPPDVTAALSALTAARLI